MAIPLPKKNVGNYLYIMASLLITSHSLALAYIQADSCQHPAPPVTIGSVSDAAFSLSGAFIRSLTVHADSGLDVSQVNTLIFTNKATTTGVDMNGAICWDHPTNDIEANPDQNGNPSDNDELTLVTLYSLRPEESETVVIPEGLEPNGNKINDRFVIQRLPVDLTAQLEVYTNWGHLVHHRSNYINDWNGKVNQGINLSSVKRTLSRWNLSL